MKKFIHKDDGLVTIEWVGIAAVMVLAAIAITAFVMQSTNDLSGRVATGLDTIQPQAPNGPGTFGGTPPPP